MNQDQENLCEALHAWHDDDDDGMPYRSVGQMFHREQLETDPA